MAEISGNRNVTKGLMKAFMALRRQVMRDLNVAELAQVTAINNDSTYNCIVYSNHAKIQCHALSGMTLGKGDTAIVLFLNREYRTFLNQISVGKETVATDENEPLHQLSYGIIIGKI